MKASVLFKEYVWLVDTISRTRRITLREINERWLRTEMSEGVPFSRTTFRRHRQEVEDMFGIIIDCDEENRYYIDDPSLMSTDSVPRWMLGTLAVSNIVSEARGLHDRILLESIPTEGEHLSQVVEAMRTDHRIKVSYRRYGSNEPKSWELEPYCIKLFRRRWYLLGGILSKHEEAERKSSKRHIIVLSFDRILSLEPMEETFKMDKDFDAQAYFASYFGVMVDDRMESQRIVLRAYGNERYSLRDLPLHPSQQEIGKGEDYVDFEVRLHPTNDFLAQILSCGRWLKIISPESIALQIKEMLQEAVEGYK